MTRMSKVLITGASRGLGLNLVIRYLEKGETVFACYREKRCISALSSLKQKYKDRLFLIKLDVTDEKEISRAARIISKTTSSIDILINNAGVIFRNESIADLSAKNSRDSFAVNSIGPMLMVKHFIKFLKCSKNPKIINISSISGSISRVSGFGGLYSYKASKAALNMFSRLLSHELMKHGISMIILDPGLVKTRMNPGASDSPAKTASKIISAIENPGIKDSGKFITLDSKECPW